MLPRMLPSGGGGKGAKRLVFDDAGNTVALELTAEKAHDMLRSFSFGVFFWRTGVVCLLSSRYCYFTW